MFSTFKQRLLLAIFILLILSVPVGAYFASQTQTLKSRASEPKKPSPTLVPLPATSPAKELLSTSQKNLPSAGPSAAPSPSSSVATSFGPTLSLKAKLEGRPEGNQITRLFVGIMEGSLTQNPKFLLSFTLDLPAEGIYGNLSLAGLNPGTKYTALLKGSAQIATSSAFIMSPTVTNLNDGQALPLASGDLNDDNVINSADYSIAQKAFGSTPKSSNWNDNADMNKDGVINTIDLSIIAKNLGQTGASGAWTSPLPKTATPSAGLNAPPAGSPNQDQGYWIWIPSN